MGRGSYVGDVAKCNRCATQASPRATRKQGGRCRGCRALLGNEHINQTKQS